MTAAVVAPLPLHSAPDFTMPENSAEARKRRREILSTQRGVSPDAVTSHEGSSVTAPSNPRKRKMSEESDSAKNKPKKPQMKYEPDVPMTKEEAAIWRREQRRKRNRESAAASRQRQRDRITELEGELDEWKTKYADTMGKIREMEQKLGLPSTAEFLPVVQTSSNVPRPETPEPSNKAITITPRASPTTAEVTTDDESVEVKVKKEEEETEALPSKMTSRQASSLKHPLITEAILFAIPTLTA